MSKDALAAQAPTQPHATHTTNDSNSLSNLTLSQGTWFTTTATQINAIVMHQNKLAVQTCPNLQQSWCN